MAIADRWTYGHTLILAHEARRMAARLDKATMEGGLTATEIDRLERSLKKMNGILENAREELIKTTRAEERAAAKAETT